MRIPRIAKWIAGCVGIVLLGYIAAVAICAWRHPKADALWTWELYSGSFRAKQALAMFENTVEQTKLIKTAPVERLSKAYRRLGDKFFCEGDYAGAFDAWDRGRRLAPQPDDAWFLMFLAGLAKEPGLMDRLRDEKVEVPDREYMAACEEWAHGRQAAAATLLKTRASIRRGTEQFRWRALAAFSCLSELGRWDDTDAAVHGLTVADTQAVYPMKYYIVFLCASVAQHRGYEQDAAVMLKALESSLSGFDDVSDAVLLAKVRARLAELNGSTSRKGLASSCPRDQQPDPGRH